MRTVDTEDAPSTDMTKHERLRWRVLGLTNGGPEVCLQARYGVS